MTENDYTTISNYILGICGIVLGAEKRYLVEQRIGPLLADNGCRNFGDFADLVAGGASYALREKVLNAITTNETSFFRDEHPWNTFRDKLLPELFGKIVERKNREWQRRGPKTRIWSAACSTGQEPYSMAMAIKDQLGWNSSNIDLQDFGILATDISPKVLAKAMQGRFSTLDIARGLGPESLSRHFTRDGDEYLISEQLRHLIEFRALNLHEPFAQIGSFDIIFCRNILIYFSDAAKRSILSQMCETLAPGGILMLGSAENLYGFELPLQTETHGQTIYYRKK